MAFHTKSSFQSNGSAHVHDNNDNNDVIIYIGDVDSDSDNMATDDDTLPPPAGLAATVVRKAIEIETETPVDDATTSSDSSSTPSPPAKRRIPHTSAERIALATPEVELEQPVLASKYLAKQEQSRLLSEKTPLLSSTQSTSTEPTVLYLAYGSNMAAKTFEGTRGIKPISCVTVSAPTLQLTFDLPGVPYREPCFANTAFRKPPKSPPKVPDIPDVPPIPAPPGPPGPPQNPPVEVEAEAKASTTRFELDSHGDPIWDGPLYGVVYEVTRDDYAQIIATEGGGASYQDVLVPCLVVAPRMGVPEKPDIPVVPRPFLAHTLFAPQVPADKKAIAGETDDGDNDGGDGDDDDGDSGNWLARRWRAMVKRLVRFASARGRPDPGYAQPSKRYLGLLTSGAADHELPQAYQDWLGSLQPYTITSRRQTIGSILLIITALPFLLIILGVNWLPRRKGSTGRMSPAMVIVIGSIFRSVWWVYDHVFHPVFGDGERTEPSKDEGAAKSETKSIKA